MQQLCEKVESLEQSVAEHTRQAQLMRVQMTAAQQQQQEQEREEMPVAEAEAQAGTESQQRRLSDSFEGVISAISDGERQELSSDSDVHNAAYADASSVRNPRELLDATPSKAALSMAIDRFLE